MRHERTHHACQIEFNFTGKHEKVMSSERLELGTAIIECIRSKDETLTGDDTMIAILPDDGSAHI